MLSLSILQPPIVPLVVVRVRALIFDAVISVDFNSSVLIYVAEILPEVICEAAISIALTVSAESVPVKMPSLSI